MTLVAIAGALVVAVTAIWVAFRALRFIAALVTTIVIVGVGVWLIPGGAINTLVEQFPPSGTGNHSPQQGTPRP